LYIYIAFGSIALNYGVWREAAGLTSLADKVNLHNRETTYNWMWISVFSTVFAGAATDMYFNRTDIELRFRGDELYLRDSGWAMVLGLVWAEVGICLLAIFLNEWSREKLSCSIKRKNGRCIFGWRQMEGIVMLCGVSVKVWVIVEYTGVDGVINGLSNAYFGIWGSFFSMCWPLYCLLHVVSSIALLSCFALSLFLRRSSFFTLCFSGRFCLCIGNVAS
jgi:hypothetical protein